MPVVAIVGRPNVGKSALFNRIAGKRIAIVHDEPGVTRDRITAEVEWQGRPFTLVDTGGIGLARGEKAPDTITAAAMEQVALAIESADVILFVVNLQEGIVPLDEEAALRLRRSNKPVLVAVNKADNQRIESAAAEFLQLGFEEFFPVSAIHERGIDSLMQKAISLLPETAGAESSPDAGAPFKLVIVGRPNVGKSSIINALTRSERVIVSPIPGTTRDAIDVPFEIETGGVRQKCLLVDTAGVRKPRRIGDSVEFFSVKRTEQSIERADMVVFLLDAESGITEQDKKIGGKIVEARKPCILVINKWDLVSEDVRKAQEDERARTPQRNEPERPTRLAEFAHWVQRQLFFLNYAPVIFTSAKSGFHLDRLLESIRYVASQLKQKVPTALLNRTLNDAIERRQPISAAGHRLRFFYATQVKQAPPVFVLFVNRDELFSPGYEKYLGGELRKAFGYEGCPIILLPRPRPKTIESKHGGRQAARGKSKPQRPPSRRRQSR